MMVSAEDALEFMPRYQKLRAINRLSIRDWNTDLHAAPDDRTFLALTVTGLVREARLKGSAKTRRGLYGATVIDCWGVDPHADLVVVAWRTAA